MLNPVQPEALEIHELDEQRRYQLTATVSVEIKILRRDELVGSLVGHSQSRAHVAHAHALLRQQPSGLSYFSRSTGLSLARLLAQLRSQPFRRYLCPALGSHRWHQ